MKDSVKDKIVGCLYGQAVGDALGLGTEFMSKDEVKRNYPNGLSEYSQIVQDYHRKRWDKGDWTEETDMMLCIAKAIINDRCINPKTIAHNFKQWFKNKPMGIGRHTYNILALSDYESNPEKAAEIIWILSNKNSAPNGGIMRTSVVGLWNEDVAENAERICKLTHTDTRCIGSCVIISELINHFVWHNMQLSFKEILEIADRYDKRIQQYLFLAKDGELDDLNLDEGARMGYTLKPLACAVWCLYHVNSFKGGLLKIVNAGGDADTNAAVACAVLGAKYGMSGIPEYYVDNLNQKDVYECIISELTDVLLDQING